MLTPEYLWSIADSVVNIYEELNIWAVQDIAERIMAAELYKYDELPGTARYRAWLLQESGMHYEEMAKEIAKFSKKSEEDIRELFIAAGIASIQNDYRAAGAEPYDITKDRQATQLLQSAYEQTLGELYNYTRTTLDESNKQLIDLLDKSYFEIASGQRSYNESIKDAIEAAGKNGCVVKYPTGHVDTIETAVRRAVMTGLNQGTAKISLYNCEKLGTDYVLVTAHIGARYSVNDKIANHLGWQGKVYKINGTGTIKGTKIPNLEEETGFPSNPLGLCGYNCRHSFFPFMPDMDDINKFSDIVTDEEESKRKYDLAQKQRRMERGIRATKRKLMVHETAIEASRDEKAIFDLQLEYDKIAAKLKKQNKAYNEFCKENELQKEAERLHVAKWNREEAHKAVKGAGRHNSGSKIGQQSKTKSDLQGTKPDDTIKAKKEPQIQDDEPVQDTSTGQVDKLPALAEDNTIYSYGTDKDYSRLYKLHSKNVSKSDIAQIAKHEKEDGSPGGYVATYNYNNINSNMRNDNFSRNQLDTDDLKTIEALRAAIGNNTLDDDYILTRYVNADYLTSVFGVTGAVSSRELPNILDNNFVTWSNPYIINKEIPRITKELNSMLGKTIQEDAFVSTSIVKSKNIMKDKAVLLEIHAPAGTHAYVPKNRKESECILGDHTTYVLEKVEWNGIEKKWILTYKVK